jgi:large subunit ribosomal protein L29
MKVKEIRDLSPEDIKNKINDMHREIVNLRFQMAAHKLESPSKLRLARRTLSRLLTIQTQNASKNGATEEKQTEAKAPKKEAAPKAAKAKKEAAPKKEKAAAKK